MKTGQFGVVRTKGFVPAMIRLFTRSQVNHAYIYVDENHIVEAQGRGARVSLAGRYTGSLVAESNIAFTGREAHLVVHWALGLAGTPYGFLDILALALLNLGLRWQWLLNRAQSSRSLICSQLVDRAYELADVHLFDDDRPDGQVTPGDLLMLLARNAGVLVVDERVAVQ